MEERRKRGGSSPRFGSLLGGGSSSDDGRIDPSLLWEFRERRRKNLYLSQQNTRERSQDWEEDRPSATGRRILKGKRGEESELHREKREESNFDCLQKSIV